MQIRIANGYFLNRWYWILGISPGGKFYELAYHAWGTSTAYYTTLSTDTTLYDYEFRIAPEYEWRKLIRVITP